jgi:hypothetical protein
LRYLGKIRSCAFEIHTKKIRAKRFKYGWARGEKNSLWWWVMTSHHHFVISLSSIINQNLWIRIIHLNSISVVDVTRRLYLEWRNKEKKQRIERRGSYGNEFLINVNTWNDVFIRERWKERMKENKDES